MRWNCEHHHVMLAGYEQTFTSMETESGHGREKLQSHKPGLNDISYSHSAAGQHDSAHHWLWICQSELPKSHISCGLISQTRETEEDARFWEHLHGLSKQSQSGKMDEGTLWTFQHWTELIKITMSRLLGYKKSSLTTNYSDVFIIFPLYYSK